MAIKMTETNTYGAKNNSFFKLCCECAGIEPTVRQFSKFKNEKGLAYKYRPEARATMTAKK